MTILIIGLVVAGVAAGGSLVEKMKIQAAQSLTKSSDVASIKGLRLWLETSSEKSFDPSQASDGSDFTIATPWYDINPQTSTKLYALTNSTSGIKYIKKGIGGLPSIHFPSVAVTDFFEVSTSKSSISSIPFSTTNNAFTFFAVIKSTAAGLHNRLFYNGTYASNGWGYKNRGSDVRSIKMDSDTYEGSADATSNEEIISITHAGGTSGALTLYVNGDEDTTLTTTATVNSPSGGGFYIGAQEPAGSAAWDGYISEIIVYEKSLSDKDRLDVENYLSKKYSIKLIP